MLGAVLLSTSAFAQLPPSGPRVQGTASGTFSNGLSSMDGITYTGSTFDITTANTDFDAGLVHANARGILSGAALSANIDNLGSINFNGPITDLVGDKFTLNVNVSSIVGQFLHADSSSPLLSPGNTVNFNTPIIAHLTGTVFSPSEQLIEFNQTNQIFFKDSAGGLGQVLLSGSVAVRNGQLTPIQGGVVLSDPEVTPEPTPFLACGLAGGLLFVRRKRGQSLAGRSVI